MARNSLFQGWRYHGRFVQGDEAFSIFTERSRDAADASCLLSRPLSISETETGLGLSARWIGSCAPQRGPTRSPPRRIASPLFFVPRGEGGCIPRNECVPMARPTLVTS